MTVSDEEALRYLEDKHWRFSGHITTVEAELELPSWEKRLDERTEAEAITGFYVEEAKLLERLREHDTVCRGCQKPTERTPDGLKAELEAMDSCM